MEVKELTKIINSLGEKPGDTLQFFGEWFGRHYDNYHQILQCFFKDRILDIKFETGEAIKIWNPSNIIFNNRELVIKYSTCVEFLRYDYGKRQTKENLIIDRYSDDEIINPSIKNGKVYKKIIKQGYPAVELIKY